MNGSREETLYTIFPEPGRHLFRGEAAILPRTPLVDGEVAQSDVQVGASALEAVGLVEKIEFTVIWGSNFVEFLLPISGQKSEEHVAHTRSLLPSLRRTRGTDSSQ